MSTVFERLKGEKNFQHVRRAGRAWRGQYAKVTVANNELGVPRIGIVVSRKVSNKAVVRNKLRRRIKAVLGGESQWFTGRAVDVVVLVLSQAAEVSYQELKQDLKTVLEKIKIAQREET